MAFNVNDQAHVDLIKAALLEPEFVAAQSRGTTDVLELFNNPDKHANGSIKAAARLTAGVLVDAAFNVPVGSSDQFKVNLLVQAASGLEDDLSEFRPRIMGLSVNMSDEIALNVRPLNRMEVDFGVLDENGVHEYITLSKRDYLTIRDS